MKKILLLWTLLVLTIIVKSQTIGLQMDYTLPDGSVGNYFRTGQVVFDHDEKNFSDTMVCKVEMVLYKDLETYSKQFNKMSFRREVQIKYTLKDLNSGELWEVLYDRILIKDKEFFANAKRIKM
jgi:hypothetical protein